MTARHLLPVTLAAAAVAAAVALGSEATTPPPAPAVEVVPRVKLVKAVRARDDARVENRRLRAALRAARSRPEYVWWSTRDTRATAEAVWDEQGVSPGERAYWRCIITRESNWLPDVWYGGARGWQPGYAGTDRVNGLMQMRPYHADNGDRVVTYATFLRTSDPVFALRKALRLGHRPFFASNGGCE